MLNIPHFTSNYSSRPQKPADEALKTDVPKGDIFTRSTTTTAPAESVKISSKEALYLGDAVKYLDEAKKILTTQSFTITKADGEEFNGTFGEYFESCKGESEGPIPYYEVYHGTTKEVIDDILKNGGLDYTKTYRDKCGPGTYFVPSQGVAMQFGRAFLEARYSGSKRTMPGFSESFYEPVSDHGEAKEALMDGLDISAEDATKLFKVCMHSILVDDMGIDVLWSSSGYGSGAYFVVLNDDCVRLSRS